MYPDGGVSFSRVLKDNGISIAKLKVQSWVDESFESRYSQMVQFNQGNANETGGTKGCISARELEVHLTANNRVYATIPEDDNPLNIDSDPQLGPKIRSHEEIPASELPAVPQQFAPIEDIIEENDNGMSSAEIIESVDSPEKIKYENVILSYLTTTDGFVAMEDDFISLVTDSYDQSVMKTILSEYIIPSSPNVAPDVDNKTFGTKPTLNREAPQLIQEPSDDGGEIDPKERQNRYTTFTAVQQYMTLTSDYWVPLSSAP